MPLGPEDFCFNVSENDDGKTVVRFTTKALLNEEEIEDAEQDLADFIFQEEDLFEVGEFEYESDTDPKTIAERLHNLGFTQRPTYII